MWNDVSLVNYPPPAGTELPDNLVRWTPQRDRAVLLLHDMQHYFLRRFDQRSEPFESLTRNVAALVRSARELHIPIVYTAQNGDMTVEQRGLLRDFWGPGMAASAEDRAVPHEYAPRTEDTVLAKWRYSAFHNTELGAVLHREGRSQLIICGVYAHVGILATAVESYSRDIETFVVADAVADFTRKEHDFTLDYVARCCAVVETTDNVLSLLNSEALVASHSAQGA